MVPGPRRHLLRQPPTQAESGSACGEPEVDLPLGTHTKHARANRNRGEQRSAGVPQPTLGFNAPPALHLPSLLFPSFPFLPTRLLILRSFPLLSGFRFLFYASQIFFYFSLERRGFVSFPFTPTSNFSADSFVVVSFPPPLLTGNGENEGR